MRAEDRRNSARKKLRELAEAFGKYIEAEPVPIVLEFTARQQAVEQALERYDGLLLDPRTGESPIEADGGGSDAGQ